MGMLYIHLNSTLIQGPQSLLSPILSLLHACEQQFEDPQVPHHTIQGHLVFCIS